jgi:hypothetical protein
MMFSFMHVLRCQTRVCILFAVQFLAMDDRLLQAAMQDDLVGVQSLLQRGASVAARDVEGNTALMLAVLYRRGPTTTWLLDHGKADIKQINNAGDSVWDMLTEAIENLLAQYGESISPLQNATSIVILRAMVLRDDPPLGFLEELQVVGSKRVVEEGLQLRTRLPAYLTLRRALLEAHCPLIKPLLALISGYEEPTTTEELWATGLGAAP